MLTERTHKAIRTWMFDVALPFWAKDGVDGVDGGYVEQLSLDGRDNGTVFKRTRVTGRQIYVFSHAAILGWNNGRELAAHGVDFLINKAWLGQDKGFARRLSRTGAVLDATPDLYDQAFALFGLAWYHLATGDTRARDWMHRSLDYVESHMRHPGGDAFWHEMPPAGWRLQNPHMHLTEACLVAHKATGDRRFGDMALMLEKLFRTRFLDAKTGTLGEYFTDNWQRAPGDDGSIVEPGHMMEWAWILNDGIKQLGMDAADAVRTLIDFAETHGVDHVSGLTFNTVRDDGTPIDLGSRCWPNCERIKGAVAMFELDGIDPAPVIESSVDALLKRHLSWTPPGIWMDAFDADHRPMTKMVPASTLYHIFLAFAEALRISR